MYLGTNILFLVTFLDMACYIAHEYSKKEKEEALEEYTSVLSTRPDDDTPLMQRPDAHGFITEVLICLRDSADLVIFLCGSITTVRKHGISGCILESKWVDGVFHNLGFAFICLIKLNVLEEF